MLDAIAGRHCLLSLPHRFVRLRNRTCFVTNYGHTFHRFADLWSKSIRPAADNDVTVVHEHNSKRGLPPFFVSRL